MKSSRGKDLGRIHCREALMETVMPIDVGTIKTNAVTLSGKQALKIIKQTNKQMYLPGRGFQSTEM